MVLTWAVFGQSRAVSRRAIALMSSKAVMRILPVQFDHQVIPRRLGQNRRRRNRE